MGRSKVHGIRERRAGALERLLSNLKSTVSLEKGNKKAEAVKQKRIRKSRGKGRNSNRLKITADSPGGLRIFNRIIFWKLKMEIINKDGKKRKL